MRPATAEAAATGPMIRRASSQATRADSRIASDRADEIEPLILRDARQRALAIGETVAGGVVDQQIDLLVDGLGVAVERRPGDLRHRAVEGWRRCSVQAFDGLLRVVAACARRASECDRSAAICRSSVKRMREPVDGLVELAANAAIDASSSGARTPPACRRNRPTPRARN